MNPTWLEEARSLPVAFAQVREDPRIDLKVVAQTRPKARALLVGSGGCTVAALAAFGDLAALHVVDPNPAQLALTRFKLQLLRHLPPVDRLQILGHAAMEKRVRHARVTELLGRLGLSPDVLGPPHWVSQVGVDQCGRYEMLFRALRDELSAFSKDMKILAQSKDIARQAGRVAPDTEFGEALDRALDKVLALPNLIALFGAEATANRREEFSRHFARRIRFVLATLPALESPWLAQMLLGRFTPARAYPWLAAPSPGELPRITWSLDTMQHILASAEPGTWDFIHLSNILDWLPADQSSVLLEHAWKALARGGRILIRQLNSALDIPAAGPRITWSREESARLHAGDRSFFYRQLHVGTKE